MSKGWSESMQEWWNKMQAAEVARHKQAEEDYPQAREQAAKAGLLLIKLEDDPIWVLLSSQDIRVYPPTERRHLGKLSWRLELSPHQGGVRAVSCQETCPHVWLPRGWRLSDAVVAAIERDVHALTILRDGGPPPRPTDDQAKGEKTRVRRRRQDPPAVPAEGGAPAGADGTGV